MITALDTNIISAIWTKEPNLPEILQELQTSRRMGSLVICPIVHVELCAHPRATIQLVQSFLADTDINVDWEVPRKIWEAASDAYAQYAIRRRQSGGGPSKHMPADFIIGVHAMWMAGRLLTLDQRRYKTDFPDLRIKQC